MEAYIVFDSVPLIENGCFELITGFTSFSTVVTALKLGH